MLLYTASLLKKYQKVHTEIVCSQETNPAVNPLLSNLRSSFHFCIQQHSFILANNLENELLP